MYETPTPEDLRAFYVSNDLTDADLAALTGVSPRTVQSWLIPDGHKKFRSIPWTAWALVNILLGKTDRHKLLKEIDTWKKEQTGRGLLEKGIGGRPRKKLDK